MFPCNGSNICVPWSLFEQIKYSNENDHIFGLMYGFKDENTRQKLGYGSGKHKSSDRKKQAFRKVSKQKYKRSDLLNGETYFDSKREYFKRRTVQINLVVVVLYHNKNLSSIQNAHHQYPIVILILMNLLNYVLYMVKMLYQYWMLMLYELVCIF